MATLFLEDFDNDVVSTRYVHPYSVCFFSIKPRFQNVRQFFEVDQIRVTESPIPVTVIIG